MSFRKPLKSELRSLTGLQVIEEYCAGPMQGSTEGTTRPMADHKRPQLPNMNDRNYFSLQSFLVLLCLTASLLILPLVLPPLPPPPFMLLLLPIGMLVVLLVLAFMPSGVRDIASSNM